MEQKDIIIAKDVAIGYQAKGRQKVIASDISVALPSGSLTALIGANGIGKSTLLRTLTGIQQPLGGSVLLDGKPLEKYSQKELSQNLAVVLTESLPPSDLKVFELVALGRQPYTNWLGSLSPEDTAKTNKALQLTQTSGLAAKRHFELSDGQLQRVLIARALAQDTPLIILDEPTTHLDLQHKVSLLRLLKKLSAEQGKCILYSTHDLDLALQLSDLIMMMMPGETLLGTPEKLIEQKAFDRLFDDPGIVFDPEKRGFFIQP